jgi:outer membrane lipoprotein carrier protein
MRVKFEQTLTNPLLGKSLTSQGELLRKKPNFLSISFSGGEKDRIVADGKILWVYLPSSAPGQVIKMPVGSTPGALIDPFGQVLNAPADKFDIASAGTATIRGRDTHGVTMTPKQNADVLFTQATVWVDDRDATVRKIETTEPSGVTRQIVITKYSPNVSIPKDAFVFTPPANVLVVDGEKLGK